MIQVSGHPTHPTCGRNTGRSPGAKGAQELYFFVHIVLNRCLVCGAEQGACNAELH